MINEIILESREDMKKMLWVVLMMSCGATFISSLFPLYSEYYQLSSLEITILFAVYAAILLPTLFVVGAKGNAWGLKRVLRWSIYLSIVSTLLFLVSFSVWILYTARLLEGIAYGAFTGTASAFLIKQTSQKKVSTAVKLSGAMVNLGFGLGPAISGLIVHAICAFSATSFSVFVSARYVIEFLGFSGNVTESRKFSSNKTC
ncbi:MFS transporter [Neobacillus drentensis]|uniref:MFS transporter n=1 Tax=Neobacillus drentensis TaxID=220684 RepID=UPI002FFF4D9A